MYAFRISFFSNKSLLGDDFNLYKSLHVCVYNILVTLRGEMSEAVLGCLVVLSNTLDANLHRLVECLRVISTRQTRNIQTTWKNI